MERTRVSSGSPWEPRYGYCRAVRVGHHISVAGTAPIWPDGSCPDDAGLQARRCFEIIGAALSEAGSSFADVVRVRVFLTDAGDADAVGAVHGEIFADIRPVNTMVVVAAMIDPRWKLEVEVDAIAD